MESILMYSKRYNLLAKIKVCIRNAGFAEHFGDNAGKVLVRAHRSFFFCPIADESGRYQYDLTLH